MGAYVDMSTHESMFLPHSMVSALVALFYLDTRNEVETLISHIQYATSHT